MPFWGRLPCTYHSLTQYIGLAGIVQSGDISFYVTVNGDDSMTIYHAFIFGENCDRVVHSEEVTGVFTSNFNDERISIFFRFIGEGNGDVARAASNLAQSWSRGDYYFGDDFVDFTSSTTPIVGYTSAGWKKYRGYASALGTSSFGSGARARLSKYQGRSNLAPKNMTCSELPILAYQLTVGVEEEARGFIKLDAKHTTPWTLASYLYDSPYWQIVGATT